MTLRAFLFSTITLAAVYLQPWLLRLRQWPQLQKTETELLSETRTPGGQNYCGTLTLFLDGKTDCAKSRSAQRGGPPTVSTPGFAHSIECSTAVQHTVIKPEASENSTLPTAAHATAPL